MPELKFHFISKGEKKKNINVHEKHLSFTIEAEPMIRLFIILCLWHQTHDGEAAEDKARSARILCEIR